jgi:predicted GNAT family acetyltransferase
VDVNLDQTTVTHNEMASRFELHVDGIRALLTYRQFSNRMVFDHTEVPKPLEGHGLASKLAQYALDFARANHLRVVPLCPYVSGFIRKHPEYQDLVSCEDPQKGQSR